MNRDALIIAVFFFTTWLTAFGVLLLTRLTSSSIG